MAGKPEANPEGSERRAQPFEQFSKKVNEWKGDIGFFFAKLIPGKKKDVKYFRRLICCKLKEPHKMDAVIDALLALGFTDITNEESLSRRGSRTMLQYVLDDQIHRLHVRAHVIDITGYLLVHKEPLPSANVDDLLFHVRGFLERVGRQINAYLKRMASDPQRVAVNYDERAELSDYEQGCHQFRELVKEKDPRLFQSLDFYLDEHDFLAFSLKFGGVGKVLPIELLLMEFNKNAESSDLQGLSGNIHAILDTIGFPLMNRMPIKSKLAFMKAFPSLATEMDSVIEGFIQDDHDREPSFVCVFSKNALSEEFLANFMGFIHPQDKNRVLIITQESSWAMAEQQGVRKLRKKGIFASHVDLHGFKALFEKFLNTPFSAEDLLTLIRDNEIITNEAITKLSRQRLDNQQASKIILVVLDYLGRNPGWHQAKQLKQELMQIAEFSGVTESNLEHVFDFLKNPLLELVKTRNDGKEVSGIENKEEFKLKLNNMKKMLASIDMSF